MRNVQRDAQVACNLADAPFPIHRQVHSIDLELSIMCPTLLVCNHASSPSLEDAGFFPPLPTGAKSTTTAVARIQYANNTLETGASMPTLPVS